MAIAKTDWQSLLSPGSDLPPDVFFLVELEEDEGQGGVAKKIGAHRFLLAGVSPVFKGMFYGPMRETPEEVRVEETTFEAFDTMIKYIYHPLAGEPFSLSQIRCPQKLFELLVLATKYQILDLAAMTSEALESLAITRKTMIFTATVARNYKSAFDDLSTKVMMRCQKFLFDTTFGGGDMCALIKETEDNFPTANFDILRDIRTVTNEALQIPGTSADFVELI